MSNLCKQACPNDPSSNIIHKDQMINDNVRMSSSRFMSGLGNLSIYNAEKKLSAENNWKTKGPMKNGSYARYLGKKTGPNYLKNIANSGTCCP